MGLTEASTLAQDRMERFISLAYTDPSLNDPNGDNTNGLDTTGAGADNTFTWTDPSGVVYTAFWNVAIDRPIPNVKTIRMTVQWIDRGLTRRATFDFMKSDVI
jgi:hypothetical protein